MGTSGKEWRGWLGGDTWPVIPGTKILVVTILLP
jgi:hypothetical protein